MRRLARCILSLQLAAGVVLGVGFESGALDERGESRSDGAGPIDPGSVERPADARSAPALALLAGVPHPHVQQMQTPTSVTKASPLPADFGAVPLPSTEWIDAQVEGDERARYRALLFEAHAQELSGDFEASAESFAALSERFDEAAYPAWRASRAWWRAAEKLIDGEADARAALLDRADAIAQTGLERDPDCAECMLWRYAALGRLATVRGLLSAARSARTMQRLLDTGIRLKPTQSDGPHSSTLGNLYYASAVFNRMVPDSWLLRLAVGVRGDKEQALSDIREAVSLHPERVDFRVEMGAVLLCLGTKKDKPEAIREGRIVLENAEHLDRLLPTDELDLEFARIMSERPELSCSFSRDGFVDVEGAARKL
jgi:tetratricopeptide (TPR) repeat protein